MVAKIGRGQNLVGVLSYNQLKVEKEGAEILYAHKILETPDGHYSTAQLSRSFEPYLLANRKTEKTVVHISLNPDPKDNVSDEKFKTIAQEYMKQMGYEAQPFVVFKHTDIERTHIHIVSVCVNEEGRKISDSYERKKSMNVCRELEKKYGLISAIEKQKNGNKKEITPIDYKTNDLKSQVASVVRYLPKQYQFQSLGEYNALLSLSNIKVEEVKGELHGKLKQGLVYFVLNEDGIKASNPFKASLFGKNAGHIQLQSYFEDSKVKLKQSNLKRLIIRDIEAVIKLEKEEQGFKNQLAERGINVVVRRNEMGRIYGITFIDHNTKSIWNGSRLGTAYSANVFNDWWNNNHKPEIKNTEDGNTVSVNPISKDLQNNKPHDLFDFINRDDSVYGSVEHNSIESFGGLLPQAQGEDYEEQAFTDRLKKKRKSRKKP